MVWERTNGQVLLNIICNEITVLQKACESVYTKQKKVKQYKHIFLTCVPNAHAVDCNQHWNKVMDISILPRCRSILDQYVKEVRYHTVNPHSWGKTTFKDTPEEMSAASVKSLLTKYSLFLTNVATVKHTVSDIRGVTGNSAPCNSHML